MAAGHVVYIVSIRDGALLLGGRMTIKAITSRSDAIRITGGKNLYPASEWIIAKSGSGSRLDLHRQLAPELAGRLLFLSPSSEPKRLHFVSDIRLDGQTTRGVRELTPESAALLDAIIETTDHMPRVLCDERGSGGASAGRA